MSPSPTNRYRHIHVHICTLTHSHTHTHTLSNACSFMPFFVIFHIYFSPMSHHLCYCLQVWVEHVLMLAAYQRNLCTKHHFQVTLLFILTSSSQVPGSVLNSSYKCLSGIKNQLPVIIIYLTVATQSCCILHVSYQQLSCMKQQLHIFVGYYTVPKI